MSEDLKTIKELADELGVSKATMFRFLRDNSFTETKMYKNKKVYDSYAVSQIKESFINSRTDSNFILYEQVKTQNKIISEQSKQLSQMQNLLDQQQRLALQDKKLLEEYKAENDSLKALKMPTREPVEEQTMNEPQEVEQPREAPKKWWQLWK